MSEPGSPGLRSDAWLGGDDEVALNHRAALRAAGLRSSRGRSGRSSGRPLIGIACTASGSEPVRDGDMVMLDAYAGTLSVDADLDARSPVLPVVRDRRGWPVLHRMHVLQAPEGCDYDFLRARTSEDLAFVEPVIGRS